MNAADAQPAAVSGLQDPPGASAGTVDLLSVLQYADSLFPSGATAFSWGLEPMQADGLVVDPDGVLMLMQALVERRWAGFDRALLWAAHRASALGGAAGRAAMLEMDRLCEAMTLNQGARAASRRLGFTQLRVHAELGLPVAATYLELVRSGQAPGHLPVMQGLVWQARGLSLHEAERMSAFGVCLSVVGAAMRLGMLGHLESQRLLGRLRPTLDAALEGEPPTLDEMWTGAPALEIAAMRHESRPARLFAT